MTKQEHAAGTLALVALTATMPLLAFGFGLGFIYYSAKAGVLGAAHVLGLLSDYAQDYLDALRERAE